MQKELAGTTRIVVTHALHFLPYMDYIITLNNGSIVEEGTYSDLIARGGAFARFIEEFGSSGPQDDLDKKGQKASEKEVTPGQEKEKKDKPTKKVMQLEDRNVGSVSFKSEFRFPSRLRIM